MMLDNIEIADKQTSKLIREYQQLQKRISEDTKRNKEIRNEFAKLLSRDNSSHLCTDDKRLMLTVKFGWQKRLNTERIKAEHNQEWIDAHSTTTETVTYPIVEL